MTVALQSVRAPLALIAVLILPLTATAQTVAGPSQGSAPPPDRNSLIIGFGGGIGPDHEGSNETAFQPGGVVQGQLDGFDFQVRGTNLYVDLVRDAPRARTALTLGPVVQVRLERTGRIRDPRVAALGDRKTAVELGGYAGVSQRGVVIAMTASPLNWPFSTTWRAHTAVSSSPPACPIPLRFRAAPLPGRSSRRTMSAKAMGGPIST